MAEMLEARKRAAPAGENAAQVDEEMFRELFAKLATCEELSDGGPVGDVVLEVVRKIASPEVWRACEQAVLGLLVTGKLTPDGFSERKARASKVLRAVNDVIRRAHEESPEESSVDLIERVKKQVNTIMGDKPGFDSWGEFWASFSAQQKVTIKRILKTGEVSIDAPPAAVAVLKALVDV